MLIRILLALAVLAGLSAPATAQECQRSRAPTVTFAEAASDNVIAPCVEIEGVVVGSLLVEDGYARYRMQRIANDPSSSGAVLGYYGAATFDVPMRVRVIGRLTNCASIEAMVDGVRAQEPGSILLMTGYCHYHMGRVIQAVYVEPLGPADFFRALPTRGEIDLGNLSPLAEGDTRRQMLAAAERFLSAVRVRDRDTLAVMHGGGPNGRRAPRDLERVLAIMLESPDSPFADLQTRGAVTTEIFGWKPPRWADEAWRAEATRTGTADAIACFSERSDAAALWPIDSKDADNIPGRPYACTRIHIGSTGMDAPASFDTEQARSGVAEPAR